MEATRTSTIYSYVRKSSQKSLEEYRGRQFTLEETIKLELLYKHKWEKRCQSLQVQFFLILTLQLILSPPASSFERRCIEKGSNFLAQFSFLLALAIVTTELPLNHPDIPRILCYRCIISVCLPSETMSWRNMGRHKVAPAIV